VLIENSPGAGTAIGTEAVSRAAPDGNTLLLNGPAFVINPHLKKVDYDPVTGFEAICQLVSSPQVMVVNKASPYRTLVDLFNAARAKPGDLTLASVGPGSDKHIMFEMLKRAANVDMIYVPFPGAAPAVNALLGGHVTAVLANYVEVVERVKAGKLRALASASREPLPDVPTVAESSYQDYLTDAWFGVFAPAKTPKAAISQLAGWFGSALQVPEIKAKLVSLGLYPVGTCGADFADYVRNNMTNTAARFAKRTSKLSDPGRDECVPLGQGCEIRGSQGGVSSIRSRADIP
jgi:tripartite-type tricarboxylate transporter receptor subunit TctC